MSSSRSKRGGGRRRRRAGPQAKARPQKPSTQDAPSNDGPSTATPPSLSGRGPETAPRSSDAGASKFRSYFELLEAKYGDDDASDQASRRPVIGDDEPTVLAPRPEATSPDGPSSEAMPGEMAGPEPSRVETIDPPKPGRSAASGEEARQPQERPRAGRPRRSSDPALSASLPSVSSATIGADGTAAEPTIEASAQAIRDRRRGMRRRGLRGGGRGLILAATAALVGVIALLLITQLVGRSSDEPARVAVAESTPRDASGTVEIRPLGPSATELPATPSRSTTEADPPSDGSEIESPIVIDAPRETQVPVLDEADAAEARSESRAERVDADDPTPLQPSPSDPRREEAPVARPSAAVEAATIRESADDDPATRAELSETDLPAAVADAAAAEAEVSSSAAGSAGALATPPIIETPSRPARRTFAPRPAYPDRGQALGMSGTVVLSGVVGVDGRVEEAQVLRSLAPEFDRAALEAFRTWQFVPAADGGEAVRSRFNVGLHFRADDRPGREPLPFGGSFVPPVRVEAPAPIFPPAALASGLSGNVVLRIVVEEDGSVGQVAVLDGLPGGLTEAAVAAVRGWRFRPATRKGIPVAVYHRITVRFAPV
ncbi:MAG: TonB family protein [Acidobacteriota bacterium]